MHLKINHNMEMAHRLSKDTTKCKQIHGHGMQVELVFLNLEQDPETGMCKTRFGATMEFGAMKRKFRDHIDNTYDHHLVLNEDDDFAQPFILYEKIPFSQGEVYMEQELQGLEQTLPGLTTTPGEPTVENLAKWIGEWAATTFQCDVLCSIEETKTNGASVEVVWTGTTTKVRI